MESKKTQFKQTWTYHYQHSARMCVPLYRDRNERSSGHAKIISEQDGIWQ